MSGPEKALMVFIALLCAANLFALMRVYTELMLVSQAVEQTRKAVAKILWRQ